VISKARGGFSFSEPFAMFPSKDRHDTARTAIDGLAVAILVTRTPLPMTALRFDR
jgi:hypothetical protein